MKKKITCVSIRCWLNLSSYKCDPNIFLTTSFWLGFVWVSIAHHDNTIALVLGANMSFHFFHIDNGKINVFDICMDSLRWRAMVTFLGCTFGTWTFYLNEDVELLFIKAIKMACFMTNFNEVSICLTFDNDYINLDIRSFTSRKGVVDN
jgi:hypothetical protein